MLAARTLAAAPCTRGDDSARLNAAAGRGAECGGGTRRADGYRPLPIDAKVGGRIAPTDHALSGEPSERKLKTHLRVGRIPTIRLDVRGCRPRHRRRRSANSTHRLLKERPEYDMHPPWEPERFRDTALSAPEYRFWQASCIDNLRLPSRMPFLGVSSLDLGRPSGRPFLSPRIAAVSALRRRSLSSEAG